MQLEPTDLIYKEITVKGFWALKEFERASADEMRAMISELIQLNSSYRSPKSFLLAVLLKPLRHQIKSVMVKL